MLILAGRSVLGPHASGVYRISRVATIVAALAMILLAARPVQAHTGSFRFVSSTAYLINDGTSYANAIVGAVNDYDDNTDMVVWYGTSCYDNYLCYKQSDRGSAYAAGTARAYRIEPSDSLRIKHWCVNLDGSVTGYCSNTTKRATGAHILLNTNSNVKWILDQYQTTIMRHEAGHVFGMMHGGCSESSIMQTYQCSNPPRVLQPHDKSAINSWY